MGHSMAFFVVIGTMLLTKLFPYNHNDGTNSTPIGSKYEVHYITVSTFSLNGRKLLDSM